MKYKIRKTEEEWKKTLSPEAYRVLRQSGTERAFTGEYTDTKDLGTYHCAGCDFELFSSENKYHSGCGWPSFWGELDTANIEQVKDNSHGMLRVELLCSNCGSHLGHIFNDGPPPSGQRYCINSVSMTFHPEKKASNIHVIDLHFQGIPNVIAAFLVETSAGPVLIETGPFSCIEYLEKGIKDLGYAVAHIKHVMLTHIHLDHAGAAWYFAKQGANIYVHPFGKPHLEDPSRLLHSAKRIYQDQMDALWGSMEAIDEAQLIGIDDSSESILVGETVFKGIYTPGHAIHHLVWQVGEVIFSGDAAGAKINTGMVVPPCPPPDINIEDWQQSIEKIRAANPKEIYLTHYDKVSDVKQHLNEIELILLDWANWMKIHYEKGTEIEAIIPLFEAYTAQQLSAAGIDEMGIQQYQLANPAWMSVNGLMRYWRKKLA